MINSKRVTEIFFYCLFKSDEIIEGKPIIEPIYVDGISSNFGFNSLRIKEMTGEINNIINELPKRFSKGDTFLNFCMTQKGDLWTGSHQICEELMVLGIACKRIEYCCSKDMWSALPAGLPYIYILELYQN